MKAKDAPLQIISDERLDAMIEIHFGDYLSGAGFEVCMACRELVARRFEQRSAEKTKEQQPP